MKKLLGLLAATGLVATTGATTVVACNNDKGTQSIDLGTIDNIFPETILGALKAKNSSIDTNQLEVFSYDATGAKLVYKKDATASNKEPIIVSYKIKALDISENNVELVRNIIAGKMDQYGVIDHKTGLKDLMDNHEVSVSAVIDSFSRMNGVYLTNKDIEILDFDWDSKTVVIKSLDQNKVKGDKVTIEINNNVKSSDILRVSDIGTIYVPDKWFDQLGDFYGPESTNVLAAYSMAFQNVGDRNQIFNYLAEDMKQSALALTYYASDTPKDYISDTHMLLNLSWNPEDLVAINMGNVLVTHGIIASESPDTDIKFNIKKEDRVIFGEHKPQDSDLKVSKAAFDSGEKSVVVKEIYEQMDADFKSKISLELLEKYCLVHFNDNPTIETLPGGDYLYAMDPLAFVLALGNDPESIDEKYKPANEGTEYGYKFVVTE